MVILSKSNFLKAKLFLWGSVCVLSDRRGHGNGYQHRMVGFPLYGRGRLMEDFVRALLGFDVGVIAGCVIVVVIALILWFGGE